MEATILHADLDSFYASVEQRDDASLRGRPVIVGAGVVLAASYEAKAFGVFTPMPLGRARRLCPDAVVVPPRLAAYSEASKAAYEVFDDTSPFVEGLSIDEAFLDVRGMRRVAGTPEEIAARLRVAVRERVGLPITVGVARTKFLARSRAASRSRTACSSSRPTASSRSCTRFRSSGSGAWGRRPRRSSGHSGSKRSATSRTSTSRFS